MKKWFYKHLLKKVYQEELNPLTIRKILILRYDRLGDMVVTLPLIATLKEAYPHYQIDVLASRLNQSIIENNPNIHKVYIYNFRERSTPFHFFKVFKKLQYQKYDLVIDPFYSNISRSAFQLKVINARFNIGLEKRERYGIKAENFKLFYAYTPFDQSKHLSENILNISTLLDLSKNDFKKEGILDYLQSYEKDALTFIKPYQNKKIILFNIQGSAKIRSFNDEFIMTLTKKLIEDSKTQVILMAMPERKKKLQTLVTQHNNMQITLANTKTILDATALIKYVDVIISPDTSIVHIASCFQKKIISFYKDNEMNKNIFSPSTEDYKMFIYNDLYALNSKEAESIFNTIEKEKHLL